MDVGQYLEIFIDESSEHIQTLSDCIMTLEQEPDNKDTINEVFRAAHSLKGMAGTMGFKRMQHLTHDMENVFQEVRSDKISVDSAMIDLLFKCLDAIDAYVENIKATSDEGTDDNEYIIKELNDFIAKANGEEVADKKEEKTADAGESAKENANEQASEQEAAASDTVIELTDSEHKAIMEAKESGHKIYGLTVTVQKECLLKAARAFLVFRAVEEFGQILVYRPSSQDVEDEKFDLDFSFYIASTEDYDKIYEAAKNVSEIENVVGGEVTTFKVEGEEPEEHEETKPVVVEEKKEELKPVEQKKTTLPAKKAPGKPATSRTVRVDIEKLDALMNQVSELIIAKNSLVSISTSEDSEINSQSLHEQIEYLERITTNLHESVMKVRMVPIESVTQKYPRMIRDLSRTLNKKMNLVITGEDTELDRTVVDQIGDPLQHLLRNSADHGLESNELRLERGKPEVGTIFLNAYQEGNNVIIQVGDDGNGIDTEAVKAKAIDRGLVTAEQADNMSQKEIVNFLFMPSFSMARKITDISGRGVGLDVVKSGIEQLGGDVEVSTELGKGTTFTVRLPLTLAIIQALMVEIRDEKYAIALGSISNIEDIPVEDIKYVQAKEVIHLRGSVIPIIRLDKMLDIEPKEQEPDHLTVVIVQRGDAMAGLVVDNLMGQQEIVIKSLGKYINGNKLISGATILGDGEVALILDVNTLM
ncbi:MAG: chemotaxis protein CheA [Agathobacter sp.]|nr:chemotaxis protein CheA [Agathobacter sp.]